METIHGMFSIYYEGDRILRYLGSNHPDEVREKLLTWLLYYIERRNNQYNSRTLPMTIEEFVSKCELVHEK